MSATAADLDPALVEHLLDGISEAIPPAQANPTGRRHLPRRRTAVAAGAATRRPVPGHARRTDRQRALRHHGRVPACRAAGPSPGARRPAARQRRHAVAHHAGHAANFAPAAGGGVGGHRRAIPAEIRFTEARRFAPSGDRPPATAGARRVAAGVVDDLAFHSPDGRSAAGIRRAVRDQRQAGCRPAPQLRPVRRGPKATSSLLLLLLVLNGPTPRHARDRASQFPAARITPIGGGGSGRNWLARTQKIAQHRWRRYDPGKTKTGGHHAAVMYQGTYSPNPGRRNSRTRTTVPKPSAGRCAKPPAASSSAPGIPSASMTCC